MLTVGRMQRTQGEGAAEGEDEAAQGAEERTKGFRVIQDPLRRIDGKALPGRLAAIVAVNALEPCFLKSLVFPPVPRNNSTALMGFSPQENIPCGAFVGLARLGHGLPLAAFPILLPSRLYPPLRLELMVSERWNR